MRLIKIVSVLVKSSRNIARTAKERAGFVLGISRKKEVPFLFEGEKE